MKPITAAAAAKAKVKMRVPDLFNTRVETRSLYGPTAAWMQKTQAMRQVQAYMGHICRPTAKNKQDQYFNMNIRQTRKLL